LNASGTDMTKHNHVDDSELNFPDWVRPPFQQCFNRLADETKFLHLATKGLAQIAHVPKLIQWIQKTDEFFQNSEPATPDYDWRHRLLQANQDAEWVEREIVNNFPILHSHSVVAIWSILEVLVEDLAVCWLANTPEAWKLPQILKLKIAVGEYERLSPPERPRYIIYELNRSLSVDLKAGLGRLDPILSIFGIAPIVGHNLRQAIYELGQIRNVIVHRGSRVDQKLLDDCPWLTWRLGEEMIIDHPLCGWYHFAAERYAERVLNQVLVAFGNIGCSCPGMDTVGERPDGMKNQSNSQESKTALIKRRFSFIAGTGPVPNRLCSNGANYFLS
jgi:hypothetical protein